MSATILRVVILLSIVQTLLLAVIFGGDLAHAGLRGSAGLIESVDCVAPSHHDDAPPPACPHHAHCCVLGSAIASLDLVRAFVLFRPESREAETIALANEEREHGPDPSPPWASRAPPAAARTARPFAR